MSRAAVAALRGAVAASGVALVALPMAVTEGAVPWRVGLVGAVLAVAAAVPALRALASLTRLAVVVVVVVACISDPLSVPAAVLTGLLMLVHVLLVDLTGQVERAQVLDGGLWGWVRDQSPGLVAAVTASSLLAVSLALAWQPTALVVAAAPLLLLVAAMVAVVGTTAEDDGAQERSTTDTWLYQQADGVAGPPQV